MPLTALHDWQSVLLGPVQLAHPVAHVMQVKSLILPYLPTGQLMMQVVPSKK